MQVQLFKKVGTYKDKKDGKEKQYTNFYFKWRKAKRSCYGTSRIIQKSRQVH